MKRKVYICDAVRTPIGRYGGSLATVRTDQLATLPLRTLIGRYPQINWSALDDVIMGCANQAGEDNRNVARMAVLLSGLPLEVSGVTVNRLCGSGMEAVGNAARMIVSGEADLVIAGGVESMTRSPLVMDKPNVSWDRTQKIYDTTIGWRFPNPDMEKMYGVDSMIETAENLAEEHNISRESQDIFAHRSQIKAAQGWEQGKFADEIMPVIIPQKKGEPMVFERDEHPRLSSVEKLGSLKPIVKPTGTVTAGNSSGVNDGAAALIIASEDAVNRYGLNPLCSITGMQAAGVPPRIMGIGPVASTQKLLHRLKLELDDFDLIEINEAFASQSLACLKLMNLQAEDPRINPMGGAIALGHPLGMSGARLVTTAAHQLNKQRYNKALCTMCIGVGQGISMVIEKV